MTNKASSFPNASAMPPLHRFGGVLASTPELAMHALGDSYLVEGTGTVRSLPNWPKGPSIEIYLVGQPTFVHSSKLLMPGAQSYTFSPGDSCRVFPLGDGVWRVVSISRADGLPFNPGGTLLFLPPQGRLTAVPGVGIPTTDQAAVTTLYYTASQAPVSDGTNLIPSASPQLSIALDSNSGHTGYHQSGKNFDVFKFNDSGTIRIGTGPTWNSGTGGSDNARGTGAGSTDILILGSTGIWVNTNSIALRWGSASGNTSTIAANQAIYLGTFRTTADGQTEDSLLKRFTWTAYNPAQREMKRVETTPTWPTTASGFTQVNNSTANQLEFVLGLSGGQVEAELMMTVSNSTATARPVNCAIALDATSLTDGAAYMSPTSTIFVTGTHKYRGLPSAGYHKLVALQNGAGTDTQTWYGGDAFRLYGSVWA